MVSQAIFYSNDRSSLLYWEFSDATLNSISLAVLSTILSFNLAAVIFKVILGLKHRGNSKIRDLHTVLLARNSSPLSVAASIFPFSSILRAYYRAPVPEEIIHSKRAIKIPYHVIFKLSILLIAAPIVNIIAVAATIQWNTDVKFKDAGFSGIGYGIDINNETKLRKISSDCAEFQINTGPHDEQAFDLMRCFSPPVTQISRFPGNAELFIWQALDMGFFVSMSMNEYVLTQQSWLLMNSNQDLQAVKLNVKFENVKKLVEIGIKRLAEVCELDNYEDNVTEIPRDKDDDTEVLFGQRIPCPSGVGMEKKEQTDILEEEIKPIGSMFAPIPSEDFNVRSISKEDVFFLPNGEFFPPDDFTFVRRRMRAISTFMLFHLVLVALLLNVVLEVFLNNDHEKGIELILKNRLGLHWYQSMLEVPEPTAGSEGNGSGGQVVYYGTDSVNEHGNVERT